MKIENSNQTQPITGVSVNDGHKRADGAANTGLSSGSGSEQTVHLSSQALQTNGASDSGSVVDVAKVQEIKQAISEGSFKVNPEVVADRLLETVRELIQSKTGAT